MREFLLYVFEFLTIVFGVFLFVSAFSFTSKGLVSRKTLVLTFICLVLFTISLWLTGVLTEPSIAVPTLFCLTGVMVLAGIVFAIKYFTLPIYKDYIEKKIGEYKREE